MTQQLRPMKYQELTHQIIAAFYEVYKNLGYGFLEAVYENAMALELAGQNLRFHRQFPIEVYYKGQILGAYVTDLLVEDCVIVELKAVKALLIEHESQLLNYLTATRYEVGLLFNFGPQPQIKRKVYDNELKKYLTIQTGFSKFFPPSSAE